MRFLRHILTVVALAAATTFSFAQATPKPTTQPASKPTVSAPATAGQIDINTATAAQLKTLPGIGDAYAERIVKNRPYTAKNQLVSRGIIPAAAYEKVKDSIIAHRK